MSLDHGAAAELLGSLSQLMRTTRSVAHRQSQVLGASSTHLAVLKSLHDGPARPGDLAQRLCVAPSVISRQVAPLERAGLVERGHDPDDARAWRLALTPLGRRQLEVLHADRVAQVGQLLRDWDEDDVRTAATLMDRLSQSLVAAPPVVRPAWLDLPPEDTPSPTTTPTSPEELTA
ncbi:MAG: MarR family winged helix-turn-helix transcriptional regulator [Oryzihumus sp.]